jgi:hypothetical protein
MMVEEQNSITTIFGEDLFKEIHGISEESFWRVVLTPKYVNTMEINFNTLGTGYLNCLYVYKRKSASPVLNVLRYWNYSVDSIIFDDKNDKIVCVPLNSLTSNVLLECCPT